MSTWTQLNAEMAVSEQLAAHELSEIYAAGFRSVICNRPDAEGGDAQPSQHDIAQAAQAVGLQFAYLPLVPGQIGLDEARAFAQLISTMPGPVLAYCRTGNRSQTVYQLAQSQSLLPSTDAAPKATISADFDVVIVGGGSGGIGVAASLLKRDSSLSIAIIEPSESHYYQPAWTLVGGGAYDSADTERTTASVIPKGVQWLQAAASRFIPDCNRVALADGREVSYQQLVVCPGLELHWAGIEGLEETLGANGVTSNYRFDLAPYTWELVQELKGGTAIFSQPSMPIKCAGAPQKAMYLSCDHWLKQGRLANIKVEFCNAGAVLFGVATFVPPLMQYVERYGIDLAFNHQLVKVDGPAKTAWFDVTGADGEVTRVEKRFDILHAVPPQRSPDVVRNSPLANAAGWCEVDQHTLQSQRFANVFSLGDACSAPNAKTMAAVRKQIVIVAENLLALRAGKPLSTLYDGYGACPLTVEKGKVVMAEFGFGGKLLPTFPLDPAVPRRSQWFLKATILPMVYWNLMLKGHEWLARPSK
ncbi:TIGR01244 family sulfur transferase [Paraperlucidibaca wandonensis]|uniref:TIGR01244 family sulfur transferase n=1 Tax=Paraperlucidibaca wandonensis TaxID=1268273 RepID=A0ABW3HJR8_9GAMM